MVPSQGITIPQAVQKFRKICKEELHINPVIKQIQDTLWIYVPIKKDLLEFKASKNGPQNPNEAKTKISIRFLDTVFKDNGFYITYDIARIKTYARDYGYSSVYSDYYQNLHRGVFSAMQRSLLGVGEISGDIKFKDIKKQNTHKRLINTYIKTDIPPLFIVVVIADIKTGIELESMFYFNDLKRAYSITANISGAEYMKRYISDLRGNINIIGDEKGKHLNYRQITMGEFLAKQIANRIRFKYERSQFPPSANTKKEILQIVKTTVNIYKFTKFQTVTLKDLKTNQIYSISKQDLL